jgi:hypothetical protein
MCNKYPNGTLSCGYTAMTWNVTLGDRYYVTVDNTTSYAFSHWANGSTQSTIAVTPSRDTMLIAYYTYLYPRTDPQTSVNCSDYRLPFLHEVFGSCVGNGQTDSSSPSNVAPANQMITEFSHVLNLQVIAEIGFVAVTVLPILGGIVTVIRRSKRRVKL